VYCYRAPNFLFTADSRNLEWLERIGPSKA
jgi:hypothetical protein